MERPPKNSKTLISWSNLAKYCLHGPKDTASKATQLENGLKRMDDWLEKMDSRIRNCTKMLMILIERNADIPTCARDLFQLKRLADEIRIVKADSCMYIKILNDKDEPKIPNHTLVIQKTIQLIGNVQNCDEASLEKAKICSDAILNELKPEEVNQVKKSENTRPKKPKSSVEFD